MILELVRLSSRSRLLSEMVAVDTNHQLLMAEARQERDEANAARQTGEARLALVIAAGELIQRAGSETETRKTRRRLGDGNE